MNYPKDSGVTPETVVNSIPIHEMPNFTPKLHSFYTYERGIIGDLVGSFANVFGYIISNRFKVLLEAHQLPPTHIFQETSIQQELSKKKNWFFNDYWFFKSVFEFSPYIDFSKNSISYAREPIIPFRQILDAAVLLETMHEIQEKKQSRSLELSEVFWVLKSDFNLDFFCDSQFTFKTYVSERLKNAIEAEGLTGMEFVESDFIQTAS